MSSILDRQRERFAADAGDRRAFEALEEAAFVAGDWNEVAALLERRLGAADLGEASPERAQLLFRLGQAEKRRGAPEAALVHWKAAVAADPTCRAALDELFRDAVGGGRFDVALQIAEAEFGLAMPDDERAALHCDVGGVWLDHLDDADQALLHFERSLAARPGHRPALEGAARAAEQLERARQAADYWSRAADLCKGKERARASVAAARLLAAFPKEAVNTAKLYRSALTEDPQNAEALEALATLAEAEGQWPLASDLLERRHAAQTEAPERAALAWRIGRIHWEELHEAGPARAWLERAVRDDAARPEVWRALVEVERESGSDDALRRALAEWVRRSSEPASVATLIELASLDTGAGDEDMACERLRAALEMAPDDALVIESLSDSLARLGRWEELAELLERRAALASSDPSSCASAYAELGSVQEENLGDGEAAQRSYERALQAEPAHAGAIQALERLYRKTESWQPLRTLLEHAGSGGARGDRPARLCALGDLLQQRFDDPEGATQAYDAALELDHTCAAAHRGRQGLAEAGGDPDSLLAAYAKEAAATTDRSRLGFLCRELTRLLEERERTDDALEWAERWMALAPEDVEALELAAALHERLGHDEERVALLERMDPLLPSERQARLRQQIARLHAEHGRKPQAIDAYHRALEADPADLESLEALATLLESGGTPEDLARAYRGIADLATGAQRIECLDRLARVLEERLGDLPQAIDVLETLTRESAAPDDVEERLESLLERTARYEELVERIDHRIEGAAGEPRRELALRGAGILLEQLSRFDDAVAAYRGILEEHPDCETAKSGLERSLRASADPRGLAEFLAEQSEQHADPETRDRFAFERAVILDEVLESHEEAAESLHRLSRDACRESDRERAAQRLSELLERTGDFEGLRAHWEECLRTSQDETRRAELHRRLGALCRQRLADPDAAVEHLESAAQLEPGRIESWQALARLYEEQDRPRELARVLEAELTAGREAALLDPARERALCTRIASLCATQLSESDRARLHYERVIELDPGDSPAGEFLIDYWEANGRPDEVARILERRLAALDGKPRDEGGRWAAQRTSLRLRIAGLRAHALADLDGAIAVLEPALGEIGPEPAVAEPLADLYQRAGYVEDLIDLCQRASGACEPGLERAGWLVRLADALHARGSAREAVAAYERAADDRPGDSSIEAALRELYRELGDAEPLAHLLEAELSRLNGPPEVPVRLELAKLQMGPLRRGPDALLQLRRVVHLDPGHAEALEKGLELAERLERPVIARELLDGALHRRQTTGARADLLVRRARLLETLDGQAEAAASDYREALSLDPERADARSALRDILEARGDWQAALECRFAEASRSSGEARAQHLESGAALAWERLSPEAALPWLEHLRRARPEASEPLARIAEAHRLAGRPLPRLRALEQQLEQAPDAARKRDLTCERARIFERDLGWLTRAAEAYEEARTFAPGDPEVLHPLDRVYRELGRDRARAEILEELAEGARGPDRVALLRDAAELHAGPLGAPQQAARLLLRATAETPRKSALHGELLRSLGEALRTTGPPDVWARCAEAELSLLDPAVEVFRERRLALRGELAAYYARAGCLDAQIDHLRALVDRSPEGSDPSGAHEAALLRALRIQGNAVELERRLASSLARTGGDADAWLELARLRDEQLSATAAAADAYRQAVALANDPVPALQGLRSAAERLGLWEEVAATIELELDRNQGLAPGPRAARLRRLGDVCWERLGSTTRASRAYASAIETWSEDFAAHRALQRLLEAMEDWRGALDLYESEVEMLRDREPQRRQKALIRAGEIARDQTQETRRALADYVAAAELGELPAPRRLELAELHHACGETEAFVEVFGAWCDDPEAGAKAADHVRLAETLEALGRSAPARARAERALELDPPDTHAWHVAARLREAEGDTAAAGQAWERAAETAAATQAAEHWRRAAALCAASDSGQAAALLRKAALADPTRQAVQADLAHAAFANQDWEGVEAAVARVLAAPALARELDSEALLAAALCGGRAARAAGHDATAAGFYLAALEQAPECAEALAGAGETLAAMEEWQRARAPLEARLAHAEENPAATRHQALLARCLERAGETAPALEHCEASLALDPAWEPAHALCVELHEAEDDLRAGVAALERWAEASEDRAARGRHLLRAAEWELCAGEHEDAAESHLRSACEADPGSARAWRRLAELLESGERGEEAAEAAANGLAAEPDAEDRAALALVRGRALEAAGETSEAARAFGEAAEADVRCLEAATSQARLLRAGGCWREAALALERFAERHPGDDPVGLAEVLQQQGRLLAGPLEDLDAATAVYRRAVSLQPARLELGTTLASLLAQRPETQPEALAQYRQILDADPANTAALHAAVRIARESGAATAAQGEALLRALGAASPSESETSQPRLALRLATGSGLDDPVGETLRRAVQKAAPEVARALGAPETLPAVNQSADATARFRAAALAAQTELTAPGLLPLPTEELADVVRCVALLALAPDAVHASGATLNALSDALGRMARRRVRRVLGETTQAQIEALDFAAWRRELRTLAAAQAVDASGGDLRAALVTLLCEAEDRASSELGATSDISALVSACPEARSLLRRAVRAWLGGITW